MNKNDQTEKGVIMSTKEQKSMKALYHEVDLCWGAVYGQCEQSLWSREENNAWLLKYSRKNYLHWHTDAKTVMLENVNNATIGCRFDNVVLHYSCIM